MSTSITPKEHLTVSSNGGKASAKKYKGTSLFALIGKLRWEKDSKKIAKLKKEIEAIKAGRKPLEKKKK